MFHLSDKAELDLNYSKSFLNDILRIGCPGYLPETGTFFHYGSAHGTIFA